VFGVQAEQKPGLNATGVENATPINVLMAVKHFSGLYANTAYRIAFYVAALHVSALPRSQESFSKHSVTEYTEKPSRAASLCSQCLWVSTSGFAGVWEGFAGADLVFGILVFLGNLDEPDSAPAEASSCSARLTLNVLALNA
jgi:hypothetical protein